MTEEQFIKLVKQPEIPMEVWYEYFVERTGNRVPFPEFVKQFTLAIAYERIVPSSRGFQRISFTNALNQFYDYYKKKFNLWT